MSEGHRIEGRYLAIRRGIQFIDLPEHASFLSAHVVGRELFVAVRGGFDGPKKSWGLMVVFTIAGGVKDGPAKSCALSPDAGHIMTVSDGIGGFISLFCVD